MSATTSKPAQTTPPKEAGKEPEEKKAAAEESKPEDKATELDPILPELSAGGTIVLAESDVSPEARNKEPGVECKVRPVKMRQLMAVGRVLTGATRPLDMYTLIAPVVEAKTDAEAESAMIAAFGNLVITVPHSEHEFINLVATLVNPVTQLTETEANAFYQYMDNPEAEDVIRVLHQAYVNEAPRMRQLGKTLIALFPRQAAEETGDTPQSD